MWLQVCLACHAAEAGVAPEARPGEPGGRPTVALEAEELSGGGSGCCCCGGGGDSAGSGGGGVGEGGAGGGDAGGGAGHAHGGGQRGGTLRVFTLRCVGGFSGLAFGDAADAACFESLVMRKPMLTRRPGASVLYVRATRTSLLRALLAEGSGQRAPG